MILIIDKCHNSQGESLRQMGSGERQSTALALNSMFSSLTYLGTAYM